MAETSRDSIHVFASSPEPEIEQQIQIISHTEGRFVREVSRGIKTNPLNPSDWNSSR